LNGDDFIINVRAHDLYILSFVVYRCVQGFT